MTPWWFPDNTVLCNFACVDALGLLKSILNGRGRWTEAVAYEASRSAQNAYARLADVTVGGWLGEPLEIHLSEADRVERVRRAAFGGSASTPLQHLGEAQTLHVIQHRPEFRSSFWLSDDRAACDHARRQGITTLETQDVMAYGCSAGDITHTDAYKLLRQMRDAGRHLSIPDDSTGLLR
ncbi:hypothetical protein AB0N92_18190 [Streptomyces sp. NPDC093248]|uniref:hypothetical protein n=1 Tax=Streptomyces sp. NPDC093248 TaxID=3155072 RepID=UPI00341FFEDE